jgi:hypothetical protein
MTFSLTPSVNGHKTFSKNKDTKIINSSGSNKIILPKVLHIVDFTQCSPTLLHNRRRNYLFII